MLSYCKKLLKLQWNLVVMNLVIVNIRLLWTEFSVPNDDLLQKSTWLYRTPVVTNKYGRSRGVLYYDFSCILKSFNDNSQSTFYMFSKLTIDGTSFRWTNFDIPDEFAKKYLQSFWLLILFQLEQDPLKKN